MHQTDLFQRLERALGVVGADGAAALVVALLFIVSVAERPVANQIGLVEPGRTLEYQSSGPG
jgi:hypothetical protein